MLLGLINDVGNNILLEAIENKCPQPIVRRIIQSGVDVNVKNSCGGTSALSAAIQSHYSVEIIQELINAGANDVNATTKSGSTLLCYAIKCRKVDHAKALISAGADLTVKTQDGSNVCDLALKGFFKLLGEYHRSICTLTLPSSRHLLKLYGYACYRYHMRYNNDMRCLEKMLIAFIDGGLSPNFMIDAVHVDVDKSEGGAPGSIGLLHLAVLWRMEELLDKLLSLGVNLEMRMHGGHTALHIACSIDNNADWRTKVINLLLDHIE